MKKPILFFILDQYADWEAAYVSSWIAAFGQDRYAVKTVSLTKDSVRSIGGFTVLPDYDIHTTPADYEGLILVGGMSWRSEEARRVKPLVQDALRGGKVLGGICDASAFLGTIGVLNHVRHTCNDIGDLKRWAGDAYTGEDNYVMQHAVRDNNIVTANGTAPLEFAKEVLTALDIAPENKISEWYNFYKLGCYNAPMPNMQDAS
ncbi:type 1 glutamine amidotransferase family protein [Candidatus Soleaferrea massiliensis]|uniref:type 1 glutamine amidotransferase family protein n=1 Tax=Candidatus Soleaferrea massiliensis TaxID=1470354 RepID=UPI00058CE05F|nr:type 1 glutamine amidotransferase family protein [Candidatus Soleaferrea massiliensis]